MSVRGSARERGQAYGQLCSAEFKEIQRMLKFDLLESYGKPWDEFVVEINRDFKELTRRDYPELFEEMEGIAQGAKTTIDEIIAWNFYISIGYWYGQATGSKEGGQAKATTKEKKVKDRCSAFIAVGDYTTDGKIVVAHNSFSHFIDGQFSNVILDMNFPKGKGHRFIMQTAPCLIWSGTDFFVTAAGIIGTETTFGGFHAYEKNVPVGYRIRTAMQYGNTMDDYVKILLKGNSGDYANSWLFGDVRKNEIMRLELGLKYHRVERTTNGAYIGFNAPYDERIRNLECSNTGIYDIRRHQGARHVRLSDLMDEHKGKIDVSVAKEIIADHYDVYLKKENMCSRTVCSHYDLDPREYMSQESRPQPFAPHGAVDGIVCDTAMAKKLSFAGRWGSSCGTAFNVAEYIKKNRQWSVFGPYLRDRPSQPWTDFAVDKKTMVSRVNKMRRNFTKKRKRFIR
jgi:hypothetical protein